MQLCHLLVVCALHTRSFISYYELCWYISSSFLLEFWRSEDVDATDLSLKVIILFFTLICFIKSFRLAPGAKILILLTVFLLAMCLPTVLFSAMLSLPHLSKCSQSILPTLSSNNMVTRYLINDSPCDHTIIKHTWRKLFFLSKCIIFMLMRLTTLWCAGCSWSTSCVHLHFSNLGVSLAYYVYVTSS